MQRRELREFTLKAIELTGGSAEYKNRSGAVSTWDGRMWHFGRLKHEMHVLHEVAHWIAAPTRWRPMPNYGLGPDPDGGPRVLPFFGQDTSREHVDRTLLELGIPLDVFDAIGREERLEWIKLEVDSRLSREEEIAAMLTVFLCRFAGCDWRAAMRTCSFHKVIHTDTGEAKFWSLATELARRGVDVGNPIPGLTGPAVPRGEEPPPPVPWSRPAVFMPSKNARILFNGEAIPRIVG